MMSVTAVRRSRVFAPNFGNPDSDPDPEWGEGESESEGLTARVRVEEKYVCWR
jgi:hypothetical protein